MSAVPVHEATTEIVAAPPRPSRSSQVVVYSARPVMAAGLDALLAEVRATRATICSELGPLTAALRGGVRAVIVDAGSPDAEIAAAAADAFRATVVVIVDEAETPLCDDIADAAAAILVRDEVDEARLALVAAAAEHGLRLWSRDISPGPRASCTRLALISEREIDALDLLARGCRDAEIAAILSLSEGAARKLVQRAVQRLGARTRCEAVSIALSAGYLS